MDQSRYKIGYSFQANRDLQEIVSFIAADNLSAAESFGRKLIDEAEATARHPLAGRMVPEFREPTTRERIFRAYRIIYSVYEKQRLIIILRFWHAARGTPVLDDENDESPEAT